MIEAVIGSSERSSAIVADLHTFALGANNQALRITRIDQYRIHDPIEWSHSLPLIHAFVRGLPETAGGPRVESVWMLRILADQLRPAIDKWDAAIALPGIARVQAVINAGASRRVQVRRIRRIDDHSHHIR